MAVQTTEEFKNGGATSDAITIEYLKARGVSVETTKEFQIGYVPGNSDYYIYLTKKFDEKDYITSCRY